LKKRKTSRFYFAPFYGDLEVSD